MLCCAVLCCAVLCCFSPFKTIAFLHLKTFACASVDFMQYRERCLCSSSIKRGWLNVYKCCIQCVNKHIQVFLMTYENQVKLWPQAFYETLMVPLFFFVQPRIIANPWLKELTKEKKIIFLSLLFKTPGKSNKAKIINKKAHTVFEIFLKNFKYLHEREMFKLKRLKLLKSLFWTVSIHYNIIACK